MKLGALRHPAQSTRRELFRKGESQDGERVWRGSYWVVLEMYLQMVSAPIGLPEASMVFVTFL